MTYTYDIRHETYICRCVLHRSKRFIVCPLCMFSVCVCGCVRYVWYTYVCLCVCADLLSYACGEFAWSFRVRELNSSLVYYVVHWQKPRSIASLSTLAALAIKHASWPHAHYGIVIPTTLRGLCVCGPLY